LRCLEVIFSSWPAVSSNLTAAEIFLAQAFLQKL
jgi:hypothetical protein